MVLGSFFSFLVSEILFLYFNVRGTSIFPENLIVCVAVLSIFLAFEQIFFSTEVAFLTSFTSIITLIAIMNYLFGSSIDPSILAGIIGWPPLSERGYAGRVFFDYLIIGLGGGLLLVLILNGVYDFFRKAREISIGQAILRSRKAFSQSISRIVETFDKHPWLVTLLIGIISLLVGIFIGMLRG